MAKPAGRTLRETVIFIVGPTAAGKTAVAVKLARGLSGEIVSCDSMQVYKRMPVLSQAPSARERKAARHHLVSVIDPSKEYSVAHFVKSATAAIESILRRGKLPIVVGGTGLYSKALIDGLFPSPKADMAFRSKMQKYAGRYGSKKLYGKLVKTDPEAARSIHPNDTRRIIRALELYHATGRTMTELKVGTKGLKDRYDIRIFGITKPREELYEFVNKRVDRMMGLGALGEVKRLRKGGLSKTAGAALGLKELSSYLDGETGLGEAVEALKMNTRRFAKRQMTWFRADKRVCWLDVSGLSTAAAAKIIEKRMRR